MQLKSNYIPFLPVDVFISRLCVHLPHEQREEMAHLVREKMILKWLLRRTMRLRVAGDRNAKNRAKRSNIQFMKFLEWPFFSESCLGLSTRTRMSGRKEHAMKEYWKSALDVFSWISSRLVPLPMPVRPSARIRSQSPANKKNLYQRLFPRSFAFQNCF